MLILVFTRCPTSILRAILHIWWVGYSRNTGESMKVTITETDNVIEFWCNNQLHRSNGPAVILDDEVIWYQFGKYHRYYGPSAMYDEWWIHGNFLK